jgi:hypothetical protein
MKSAEGATPILRFRIPRFALMIAKGIMIFKTRRAPCEKGSKTGMRRYTDSREKEEMEAMFPVLKKADWRRKKKNREMRASERVRAR